MRDPYEVLGVARTADAGAIKSAFRKLAKKLHPDANKNDPKSAARFAELNGAYEILGDETKRKQFNAGEIDAEGKPKFQGFEGFNAGGGGQRGGFGGFGGQQGGFESFSFGPEGFRRSGGGRAGAGAGGGARAGGFEDILKDMFGGFSGGGAGPRGGSQAFEYEDIGAHAAPPRHDINAAISVSLADVAQGAKKRVRLPTGKEVEVKIPVSVTDGQQIRLKGQGFAGPGGAGDAMITINIAPDPVFKREGDNLRIEVPVTLYEAVLGDKVRVETLTGAVSLAIPAGTSSGRVFRLKGKGMSGKGGTGDLLATIRIVLPEKGDEALDELMKKWRDEKPYDPRKE
jgi:DnaJ-class molecular chaperone